MMAGKMISPIILPLIILPVLGPHPFGMMRAFARIGRQKRLVAFPHEIHAFSHCRRFSFFDASSR
jgi:hypothetical protein